MKSEQREHRRRNLLEGINAGYSLDALCRRYKISKAQARHWIATADRKVEVTAPKAKDQPNILIYDIECLPNLGYFFETKSEFAIPLDFIVKPKAIISIAYKWLGDDEVHVLIGKPYDDKELLQSFMMVWDRADYAVAHNGDNFDAAMIAARMMANGLSSCSPITTIDTYKLARSKFKRHLNSNKLDHLADVLHCSRKLQTGAGLWVKCANGDREAIEQLGEYNKQDVLVLEEVFVKLLPHVQSKLNLNLFVDSPVQVCKQCGSEDLHLLGFVYTSATLRHKFQCGSCGSWSVFKRKKG